MKIRKMELVSQLSTGEVLVEWKAPLRQQDTHPFAPLLGTRPAENHIRWADGGAGESECPLENAILAI